MTSPLIPKAEVIRRLRALVATAAADRLIPIERLAQVAGVHDETIYAIAKHWHIGSDVIWRRLARALVWVENDQLMIHKRPNKPTRVTIREPQPPQENVTRVVMVKGKPRLEFQPVNPRTFPHRKT